MLPGVILPMYTQPESRPFVTPSAITFPNSTQVPESPFTESVKLWLANTLSPALNPRSGNTARYLPPE
jgi:hypothetical protein